MTITRYLKPLYPPLFALMTLLIPAVDSDAQQESERDPFRFGSAHSSQPGYEVGELGDQVVLQMILIMDRRRIAVFNGRRYQEGDFIGKYTVTSIELDKVTVENKEDKIILKPRRK